MIESNGMAEIRKAYETVGRLQFATENIINELDGLSNVRRAAFREFDRAGVAPAAEAFEAIGGRWAAANDGASTLRAHLADLASELESVLWKLRKARMSPTGFRIN